MDPFKNHLYLVGYLQGQYSQILLFQARLILTRERYAHDQQKQLEFDRFEAKLEAQLQEVTDQLFEIPRSN